MSVIREYEAHLDGKGRVTLRGAKHHYYKVSVRDDGSYLFEPRELVEPTPPRRGSGSSRQRSKA